jgi:hypothetical protein
MRGFRDTGDVCDEELTGGDGDNECKEGEEVSMRGRGIDWGRGEGEPAT